MLSALITDRTESDVRYTQAQNLRIRTNLAQERPAFTGFTEAERTAWLAGLKGVYNASDLNRVGAAMLYVAERLYAHGYNAPISPRTDWASTDQATREDIQHYLADLRTLREAQATFQTTPEVPSGAKVFNVQEANDIERILLDVDIIINYMLASRHYANQFYAGERVEIAGFRFAVKRTWGEWQSFQWGDLEKKTWNQVQYGG